MSAPRPARPARPPYPEVPTRLVVHALVREDGTVDAGELYTVAGALGMSDQQVRLCVKRLVTEGRFTHEGRGRRALLRATNAEVAALLPDAGFVRYAYRQDRGDAPWDGLWRLVAFAVPESARAARDALRDTVVALGAAPVQGGLYVTPNPIGRYVEERARELGVAGSLTLADSRDLRIGGVDEPRELAAALWPLPEIAARYERLEALARTHLARLDTLSEDGDGDGDGAGDRDGDGAGTERLAMAVTLAAEFTRAMEPDPLLPPELLPGPWAGERARTLADRCWNRLAGAPGAGSRPRLFRLYEDSVPEGDPDQNADGGADRKAGTGH
ncbi:PaaX family transcriptional regulator C-terminal domain-containing protein [Streptomyces sp. NPDC000594]|uniref:PaaX family transcriptional regulator C-terminal domain-containing protein n=1 Tax=Streptomyces sp. NPDC000594 TaxID=3154261 RepID=UPI003322A201